jgi:AcrR family transcriptional regulator
MFVAQGDQASMNDVAAEAGVARATVYRYFPNRQALLDELARVAVDDADARLGAARINEVAPEEGIARAVRALVDVGDSFVLLARERVRSDPHHFERRLTGPLRRLFDRGQAEGVFRADISSARLTESLIGLIVGVVVSAPPLGKEDMTASITGLFLDGARARGPRPR